MTVPAGREQVTRLFEELEPGSTAELDSYLDSGSTPRAMAQKYFLYNPITRMRSLLAPEVLRALPRLATLLGTRLQSFAARRFTHPVVRQILGYPAVFLGTDPRSAPAMYHLMSALDLDQGVSYPQGGFWRVIERIEALALDAGVRIITEANVTGIRTQDGADGTRVTGVGWVDGAGSSHIESADVVVSAADLHHTETTLLPPSLQTYPESWWARRTSGPGGVLVMLGVRGALPELPHTTPSSSPTTGRELRRDLRGHPDRAGPGVDLRVPPQCHGPRGRARRPREPVRVDPGTRGRRSRTRWTRRRGITRDRTRSGRGDRSGRDWAGIPDLRDRIVVRETKGPADFRDDYHSWHGGMLGPAHILSQSAMFRAQNTSKRVQGLFYAGATTARVSVSRCA